MKLNTYIPHDLEAYPFYFKTSSLVGNEDKLFIRLSTFSRANRYIYWTVGLYLSRPPEVRIDDCGDFGIPLNASLK